MQLFSDQELRYRIIQAINGDESAARDVLQYICDSIELNIQLKHELLWFTHWAFEDVLDHKSSESLFQFRELKRKRADVEGRNYDLALEVAGEHFELGHNLSDSIDNVFERNVKKTTSRSIVERAWKEYREEMKRPDIRQLFSRVTTEEMIREGGSE